MMVELVDCMKVKEQREKSMSLEQEQMVIHMNLVMLPEQGQMVMSMSFELELMVRSMNFELEYLLHFSSSMYCDFSP